LAPIKKAFGFFQVINLIMGLDLAVAGINLCLSVILKFLKIKKQYSIQGKEIFKASA